MLFKIRAALRFNVSELLRFDDSNTGFLKPRGLGLAGKRLRQDQLWVSGAQLAAHPRGSPGHFWDSPVPRTGNTKLYMRCGLQRGPPTTVATERCTSLNK